MTRTIAIWLAAAAITLASAALVVLPQGPAPDTDPGLTLRIELVRNRLYAVHPDGQVDTFKVSAGSKYHPTPRGEFAITRIVWNPSWHPPDSDWARDSRPTGPGDPDNPMGRVKMLFKTPYYYIHGTNEPELVGHVTSHGCIRLRNEDAVRLARLVMAHGGVERPDGWFERILARARSSETVRVARPVPVEVVEGDPWPLLGEPITEEGEAEKSPRP